MLNSEEYAAAAVQDYLRGQTGPLTHGPAFVAFERFDEKALSANAQRVLSVELSDDWPRIEYLVENGYSADNRNCATADPRDGYNYGTISTALQGALSRGTVRRKSADPLDSPVIDPHYLSNDVDIELAVLAFKRVREIWAGMANITLGEEYHPGLPTVSTDEQILEYIRSNSVQLWHASGTCSMERPGDSMAVVDSQARVVGVDRLRVVDASSFPVLHPAHSLATAYALALEIGADILAQDGSTTRILP